MYVSQLDFLFLYYLEMFWTELCGTQYNRVLRDHQIRIAGLLEKWYYLLKVLMVFEF